ncbi:MAG: hypothetical protein PHV37_09040 [Candidatus Gastranaerophilales bacterium]|nr:hypothetical protein [Candidatus Gastranaerophilales bacterium]
MKIKANIKAFFNGTIIRPGEVVDFDGKKIPSWATLADGENTPDKTQKVEKEKLLQRCAELGIGGNIAACGIPKLKEKIEAKEAEIAADKTPAPPTEPKADGEIPDGENTPDKNNDPDENNADKIGKLDALITTAIEKQINFDPENKTIQEQIDELEKAIADAK